MHLYVLGIYHSGLDLLCIGQINAWLCLDWSKHRHTMPCWFWTLMKFCTIQLSHPLLGGQLFAVLADASTLFDWFGWLANSYVIGLWHHNPTSLSSVYSNAGYILNGSNVYLTYILAYFPHKYTSKNLAICHISGIWGHTCLMHIFCNNFVNKCCSLLLCDGCVQYFGVYM